VVEDLIYGRRGVGTVNHRMHGKNVSIEEVLDWFPREHETKRIKTPFKGAPRIVITTELIENGPGSHRPRLPSSPAALAQGSPHPAGDGAAVPDRRGARQRDACRGRRVEQILLVRLGHTIGFEQTGPGSTRAARWSRDRAILERRCCKQCPTAVRAE